MFTDRIHKLVWRFNHGNDPNTISSRCPLCSPAQTYGLRPTIVTSPPLVGKNNPVIGKIDGSHAGLLSLDK